LHHVPVQDEEHEDDNMRLVAVPVDRVRLSVVYEAAEVNDYTPVVVVFSNLGQVYPQFLVMLAVLA
jgi:hypothetical protein